ncbi:MAG: FecR family protein [Elusimicrobia bacterium]|nr:FecR family protein [Elusimicrobiota bacterium]
MKKIYLLVLSIMFFSSQAFCDLIITKISGKVGVMSGVNKSWVTPKPYQKLDQDDVVKTFSNGKVELLFEDGTTVWLKENTQLQIARLQSDSRTIVLQAGRIRTKVIPLKFGMKFSAKTPTAVASVRGTEFILLMDESVSQLLVIAGKVDFGSLVSQLTSLVEAGNSSLSDSLGKMTPPQQIEGNDLQVVNDNSWTDFSAPAEQQTEGTPAPEEQKTQKEEMKQDLAELRQEIRELVMDVKTDVATAKEYTDEIKESDISTGRTLRDNFGNVVRVKQIMLRPDSKTLQFINITKRSDYSYKGYFTYDGLSTARIDSIDAKITFNLAMPEDITDWPSFASNNDSLKPVSMTVKFSNGKDSILMDNTYLGEKTYAHGNTSEEWAHSTLFKGKDGEWKLDDEDYEKTDSLYFDPGEGIDSSGDDIFWSWAISPKIRLYRDLNNDGKFSSGDTAKYVYMGSEAYLINNSGGILAAANFSDSSVNPFVLLKEIAFQNVMFCRIGDSGSLLFAGIKGVDSEDIPITVKDTVRNNYDNLNNFFERGNLDLVYTPDIFIPIAQKIASQFDKIDTGSKSDKNNNSMRL